MNTLTEDTIRQNAPARSFALGTELYRDGAVAALLREGELLRSEVDRDYDEDPFEVTVAFSQNGAVEAECNCSNHRSGWCGHIVAVLLRYVNEPKQTMEAPALKTLLAPLDRAGLATVLANLASRRPELMNDLELEVARLLTQTSDNSAATGVETSSTAAPRAAVASSMLRRQVRALFNGMRVAVGYGDWDDDGGRVLEMEDGLSVLIDLTDASIRTGDGRGALPMLEAITDELIDGWRQVEDFIGEADGLCDSLGRKWAEALLAADLDTSERDSWVARLDAWRRAGDHCGASSGLLPAVEAARQGWDYPPLVRVLRGEVQDSVSWEGRTSYGADVLAEVRLNLLERRGRLQEAAYLAEAEGKHDRHMELLVRLGRAQDAVDLSAAVLNTPDAALALSKTLHEHGETALAFITAERGVTLEGHRYPLAAWLRDKALAAGDTKRGIRAAVTAIKESPRLSDYTHLQEFAGDQWPGLREEILDCLRTAGRHDTISRVDIFLHEGLTEDALDVVRNNRWDYDLAARVVDVAVSEFPLQVIPICKDQAAGIMDAGRSEIYRHAARWVARARDAYRAAGRESEWQEYKAQLLRTHSRKYRLTPLLRDL